MWDGSSRQARGQKVAVFAPNLMDRSRIEVAGREAGAVVEFVAGPSDLAMAVGRGATLVIVDLAHPGVLEALPGLGPAHTVGFGSHVDGDLLRAARTAGCDEVLARSAVFRRLTGAGGHRRAARSPGDDPSP
jgi:hypothetical protein